MTSVQVQSWVEGHPWRCEEEGYTKEGNNEGDTDGPSGAAPGTEVKAAVDKAEVEVEVEAGAGQQLHPPESSTPAVVGTEDTTVQEDS